MSKDEVKEIYEDSLKTITWHSWASLFIAGIVFIGLMMNEVSWIASLIFSGITFIVLYIVCLVWQVYELLGGMSEMEKGYLREIIASKLIK